MLPTLLKLCVLAKNDPFFDHAHSLSYCHFENFQNLQFYYTFLHGKQQYKYNFKETPRDLFSQSFRSVSSTNLNSHVPHTFYLFIYVQNSPSTK